MRIAVLIPCFNEVLTIGRVTGEVQKEIPGAGICVYDNNSTDNTGAPICRYYCCMDLPRITGNV